jgi:hypothetical protein
VIASTNQAPLLPEIGFATPSEPLLLISAARDWTIGPPINFSATLLIDAVYGSYSGGNWTFERAFTSDISSRLPFPFNTLILEPDLAPEAVWARRDEICLFKVTGEVQVAVPSLEVEGGILQSENSYLIEGVDGYSESPYFTGDSGRDFCWQELADVHGCAYVRSGDLDSAALLEGNFEIENELLFWRH